MKDHDKQKTTIIPSIFWHIPTCSWMRNMSFSGSEKDLIPRSYLYKCNVNVCKKGDSMASAAVVMARHPVKAGRPCVLSSDNNVTQNLEGNRRQAQRTLAGMRMFPFLSYGCPYCLPETVCMDEFMRSSKTKGRREGWIVPRPRFLASARCLSRKARRRLRLCTSVHSLTTSCAKNLPMWWMVWPSGVISLFTISAISVGKVPSKRLLSSMVGKQCCAQYSPQWPGAWKRSTM